MLRFNVGSKFRRAPNAARTRINQITALGIRSSSSAVNSRGSWGCHAASTPAGLNHVSVSGQAARFQLLAGIGRFMPKFLEFEKFPALESP